MVYIRQLTEDDYLEHHGIKGQRWGVRRYQNEDGSLTNAGRKRYSSKTVGSTKEQKKQIRDEQDTLKSKYLDEELKRNGAYELFKEHEDFFKEYDAAGDDYEIYLDEDREYTEEERAAIKRQYEIDDILYGDEEKPGLYYEALDKATKQATADMISKYGYKPISEIKKGDTAKNVALGVAAVLAAPVAMMAVPVAIILSLPVLAVASIVTNTKNNINKKREQKKSSEEDKHK